MPGAIKVSTAKTSLLRKGFRDHGGATLDRYFLWVGEEKTRIFTFFSRGARAKEIGPPLLRSIKHQLRLDREQEARDLLICDMTGDAYLRRLRERGHLP